MRTAIIALAFGLAFSGAAHAAPDADPEAALNTCLRSAGKSGDEVIAGCTAALERTDLSQQGKGVLHQRRGTMLFDKGDLPGALHDFSQAVLLDPKNPEALAGRGMAYFHLDQYAQAIHDFTVALKYDPAHPFAQAFRGVSYAKIDDYKAAVADLDAVISSPNVGSPMVYYYRGVAHAGLGEMAKAKADFKTCLARAPEQASCKQALDQMK